jgi:hypothetical protein
MEGLEGSPFIPCPFFDGARPGYSFKKSDYGIGYYADSTDVDGQVLSEKATESNGKEPPAKESVIEGRKREVAVFDYQHCEFCRDGYVPLTLDGGVLKKVLRKSEDPRYFRSKVDMYPTVCL